MQVIDIVVFVVYFIAMLGVGFYFYFKNKSTDDYYVGGRNMGAWHIGLSVVATDVGGGFSIGLGGLGFIMGVSGSWMLLTGLIGAWISAVLLIPQVNRLSKKIPLLTFPQLFKYHYNGNVALLAGLISGIGYIGFTSSQILAGAKLASATFPVLTLNQALLVMGVIAVVYTVAGGLKAVIYTDTVQWIILMVGLIFIGIPLGYTAVGGFQGIREVLPNEFVRLDNITPVQFINWAITIIPIWFVGMTLYQRIYACKDEKTAKKAWFIAGLFEYPVMAFMGVLLGLFARVAAEQGQFAYMGYTDVATMDSEMGLPVLLRTVLPVGLTGLMLSAYFSAIMSTADSCLMAASGNVVTDIFGRIAPRMTKRNILRTSQITTLVIGALALVLAMNMRNVLDLMLLSYAFMVSGLFVPVLGILFWKNSHPIAAFFSMLLGGATTTILEISQYALPYGLDANVAGITISLLVFIGLNAVLPAHAPSYSIDDDSPGDENIVYDQTAR
jgi:SSS family solute:Na+ symporter